MYICPSVHSIYSVYVVYKRYEGLNIKVPGTHTTRTHLLCDYIYTYIEADRQTDRQTDRECYRAFYRKECSKIGHNNCRRQSEAHRKSKETNKNQKWTSRPGLSACRLSSVLYVRENYSLKGCR